MRTFSRHLRMLILGCGLSLMPFLVQPLAAQKGIMPSDEVSLNVTSGDFFNNGDEPEIVWTEDIQLRDAQWTRLHFKQLVLAHDEKANTSSVLKIESLTDGKYQILDGKTARQWYNTSAYFNGGSVRLTLTAYPNGRLNRVIVDSASAGKVPVIGRSICDSVDDRTLSDDPRSARTGAGCSTWLFNGNTNCMITAGHCAPSTDVVLFNVPISNSNGSYNFPGPEDQYSVDQTSMQFQDAGVGTDWAYFGVFDNANTGLSPLEAQGDSYNLVIPSGPVGGDEIRITGYGTTSAPVSPTFNGAQKTQVGPYSALSGNTLNYRTDTTGGNSGSPVIFEGTGQAIGVHTHGGCGTNGSGANAGTQFGHPNWQNAIANPLGICRQSVEFEFPNGRPNLVDPAGGTIIRVLAVNGGIDPEPGTGMLHVNDGNGFTAIPMIEVSPNVYDAVFPETTCANVVDYYFSAEDTSGNVSTSPTSAPDTTFIALSASGVQNIVDDNLETDNGWSVSGNATTGQWERAIPSGAGDRGDPSVDADGSGNCFLTQNGAGDTDIDGGSTILVSPALDASGDGEAVLSYFRWYSNTAGAAPESDIFVVDISNDNGSTWIRLETVGPSGPEVNGGWIEKSFKISDFLTPNNQIRLRFTASDLGDGSVVEAAIDAIKVDLVECQSTVVVNPESFVVEAGETTGGAIGDLFESDDDRVFLRRDAGTVSGNVVVKFFATSPTDSPSQLDFTFESSALSRRDIVQFIEYFDFDSGNYQEASSTFASRTGDVVITTSPAGDLSRFVNPANGQIEIRVRYVPVNPRMNYVIRLDQAIWTITN